MCGIAALAHVDPRSVKRALRGEHVSRDAGVRIRKALAAVGIAPTQPTEPTS